MKYLTILLAAALAAGCSSSLKVRSADEYSSDIRALLEEQSSFQSCYEEVLSSTPDASGTVTVWFEVEKESGKLVSAKTLDESTAPEELKQCVLAGVDGLQLTPPDDKTGEGTMTFEFSAS